MHSFLIYCLKKYKIIFILLYFFSAQIIAQSSGILSATSVGMQGTPSPPSGSISPLQNLKKATGTDVQADQFEFVGDNFIAKGDVKVKRSDVRLYADKVVINQTSKNIELSGNVKFLTLDKYRKQLEFWELEDFESNPNLKMDVVGTVMSPVGRQLIVVDIIEKSLAWSGQKAIGNLDSGVFNFVDFNADLGNWFCTADSAKRGSEGTITVKDGTISPCRTLLEGHSLYSLSASKIVAYPASGTGKLSLEESKRKTTFKGQNTDINKYHFWGYNSILYIGNIPVFWFPVLYKPAKGDMSNWTYNWGHSSSWGYYLNTTNHWQISEDPYFAISNMIDYYTKRGLGLGNYTRFYTEDTKSQLFTYLINDQDPGFNYPDFSRFGSQKETRYDVDLKNVSHLTDRLDFRGRFVKLSDMYFLYDFFNEIARTNPQPASFGQLRYQGDRFSVNLTARPRTNNFFSVVESLPKLQLNIPRQRILDNLSYEGKTSINNLQMNWREFEEPRTRGNQVDPEDYESVRFDTKNFLYYPFNFKSLNIIPRAGFRVTGYSNTSERDISSEEIDRMIDVQQAESRSGVNVVNYDDDGGSKARFIGELGLQLNTKFYRSFEDVKSAYFEIDGLRHVAEPYLNYTYIPEPSLGRENIYYFDSIDRINKQHFVRLGLENRLQTKKGGWKNPQVYTWASAEGFVDFLVEKDDDASNFTSESADGSSQSTVSKHIGDIGGVVNINPTETVDLDAEILIDGGKLLSGENFTNSINKFTIGPTWEFAEGWEIYGNYYYGNEGYSQTVYSMGTQLTRIQSGSIFERKFNSSSYVQGGLKFLINERTSGDLYARYNYDMTPNNNRNDSYLQDVSLDITRALPCGLELLLSYSMTQRRKNSGEGRKIQHDFSVNLGFSASPNLRVTPRRSLMPEQVTRHSQI